MRNRTVSLIALGMILSFGPLGPNAAGADKLGLHPSMIILVYNFRHVPPKMLFRAEREAETILGKAGLHTIWVDCAIGGTDAIAEGTCLEGGRADVVKLEVLAGPKQNVFLDSISGVAAVPSLAEVFYDYVPRLPRYSDTPENAAVVLGCVISHEIGHLLLGVHAHSIFGIMQGEWGNEQLRLATMGEFVFMKDQANLMRANVRARMDQNLNNHLSSISSRRRD
jgi:hypothetical protein